MKITFKKTALAGLLSLGLLLTACASIGPKPEDAVTQRANARWAHMVKGEMIKAYDFNTAGYKALVTPESFMGRTGIAGRWLGAKVVSVVCEQPTSCKVLIRLEYQALFSGKTTGKIDTHIDETWLLEDGQWWIFQRV